MSSRSSVVETWFSLNTKNIETQKQLHIAELELKLSQALKAIEMKTNENKILIERLSKYEDITLDLDILDRFNKKRKICTVTLDDSSSNIEFIQDFDHQETNQIPIQKEQANEITNLNDTVQINETISDLNVNETENEPISEFIKDIRLDSNIKFDLNVWNKLKTGQLLKNSLNKQSVIEYEQIKTLSQQLIHQEFKMNYSIKFYNLRKSYIGYSSYWNVNGKNCNIKFNIITKETKIVYNKKM